MKLRRGPRERPEDVFLVGEELPEEGAEQVAQIETRSPHDATAADRAGTEPTALTGRPGLRDGDSRPRSSLRWLGLVGLGIGIVAVAAIVLTRGSEEPLQAGPAANQPRSAQVIDGQAGRARRELQRERREDRLRERRQERHRERRVQKRREEPQKRKAADDDGGQAGPRAPEPAPASVEPVPEVEAVEPEPEPVSAAVPEPTTTPVTAAPPPSEPVSAPEPEPTPAPEPEVAADSSSGGGGDGGGSSCGPYDIAC